MPTPSPLELLDCPVDALAGTSAREPVPTGLCEVTHAEAHVSKELEDLVELRVGVVRSTMPGQPSGQAATRLHQVASRHIVARAIERLPA